MLRKSNHSLVRSRYLWAGLLSFAGFLVLGLAVKSGPTSLDKTVAKFFASHRTHGEVTIAGYVSSATAPVNIALLATAIIAIWMYGKGRWQLPDFIPVATIVTAGVMSTLTKSIFHRVRPGMNFSTIYDPEPSFPSSHTVFIAVAGSAFLFLIAHRRLIMISAISLVTFTVGLDRLILGVHWLTDILGSILLSLVVYFIFASLDQNLRKNSDDRERVIRGS